MLTMSAKRKSANPWPDRLKKLRVKLDISQPEAAEKADVPLATWRNWEQGRTRPNRAAVSLLANVFNLRD